MHTNSTDVSWFEAALERAGDDYFFEHDGVRLHYRGWNLSAGDKPLLLLLHGFRAHAHWWDFVAPWFADDYRVVALDFSGMGDSGDREQYTPWVHADEIAALIRHLRAAPVLCIGHSFGGLQLVRTCHRYPELVQRGILLDSMMLWKDFDPDSLPAEDQRPKSTLRLYADRETAESRFRLVPSESNCHPYVFDYVKQRSIKPKDNQWTWKFDALYDEKYAGKFIFDGELLKEVAHDLLFIFGEHSAIASEEQAALAVKSLPNGRGPVMVPDAHHHVLLDEPVELVNEINTWLQMLGD